MSSAERSMSGRPSAINPASMCTMVMRLVNLGRAEEAIQVGENYIQTAASIPTPDFFYSLANAYLVRYRETNDLQFFTMALDMRGRARERSPYWRFVEKRTQPTLHALQADSPPET